MTSETRLQELFNLIRHPAVFLRIASLLDPATAREGMTDVTNQVNWQMGYSWGEDAFNHLIPAFRRFPLPGDVVQVGKSCVPITFSRFTVLLVETWMDKTAEFVWDSDTNTLYYVEYFDMPLDELVWAGAFTVYGIMR